MKRALLLLNSRQPWSPGSHSGLGGTAQSNGNDEGSWRRTSRRARTRESRRDVDVQAPERWHRDEGAAVGIETGRSSPRSKRCVRPAWIGNTNCDERVFAADAGSGDPSADNGPPGLGSQTLGCGARQSGHGNDDHGQGRSGNVRVNQDCTFAARPRRRSSTTRPTRATRRRSERQPHRLQPVRNRTSRTTDGSSWGDELPPFRSAAEPPETMGPSADQSEQQHDRRRAGHVPHLRRRPAILRLRSTRVVARTSAASSSTSHRTRAVCTSRSLRMERRARSTSMFRRRRTRRSWSWRTTARLVFHDKNFIAADIYRNSPNRDNVYVTWTVFYCATDAGAYLQSPIYGSMSTDHGMTWSTPEDDQRQRRTRCASSASCFDPTLSPHDCDFDQGSDPVVLPERRPRGDLQQRQHPGRQSERAAALRALPSDRQLDRRHGPSQLRVAREGRRRHHRG